MQNYPQIIINKQKTHYLKNVLRLKPQQITHIFDDNGKEYIGKISHIQRHQTTLNVLQPNHSFSNITECKQATLLIGPEGCWSQHELHQLQQHNTPCLNFSQHILRIETDAIGSYHPLFQYHYDDLSA